MLDSEIDTPIKSFAWDLWTRTLKIEKDEAQIQANLAFRNAEEIALRDAKYLRDMALRDSEKEKAPRDKEKEKALRDAKHLQDMARIDEEKEKALRDAGHLQELMYARIEHLEKEIRSLIERILAADGRLTSIGVLEYILFDIFIRLVGIRMGQFDVTVAIQLLLIESTKDGSFLVV